MKIDNNISNFGLNYVQTDPYLGKTPKMHITINRNRVKVYDGDKVYLKPDTDFELEFNNPAHGRLLVKIWMNNKLISDSGLILDKNSSNYLERYIDSDRKFNFKTFMVDDVEATEKQRERNGKIRVEFYKERQPNITWTYYTQSYFSQPTPFDNPHITYGSDTTGVRSANLNSSIQPTSFVNQVESGRVEEGGKSDQEFITSTGDFEYSSFYSIEYHLIPESNKPPKEISKIRTYCSECGIRIRKSSWKFCPQCGEKL